MIDAPRTSAAGDQQAVSRIGVRFTRHGSHAFGDGGTTGITSKRPDRYADALAVTEEELGPDVVAAAGRGSSQWAGSSRRPSLFGHWCAVSP
jgi:hypothetical protein